MEKLAANCARFSGTYPWHKMWPQWVCVRMFLFVCVFMQSRIFICFLLVSVIDTSSFLPLQFISHETQALHLRKEFLKTPPFLVGVIHTTSNRKDIWSPVDVAVRQLCFHTGCCTYVLSVPHHVQSFWQLQVTCSFHESFNTFLHFPGVWGRKAESRPALHVWSEMNP